jgi:uncharacterized protein
VYVALFLALVVVGMWAIGHGIRSRQAAPLVAGALLLVAPMALFGAMTFSSELLWFDSLGYSDRFWTALWWQAGLTTAGALLGAAAVFVLTLPLRGPAVRAWPEALGAAAGALIGSGAWEKVALLVHSRAVGLDDPLLGFDVSFYLFALPVLDALLLASVAWLAIGMVALAASWTTARAVVRPPPSSGVVVLGVAAAAVLAFALMRSVFGLLFSDWGVVAGPGWTDAHVRLPALLIMAGLSVVAAGVVVVPALRRAVARRLPPEVAELDPDGAVASVAGAGAVLAGFGVIALLVAPAAVQWLVVQPSEITYEAPYIMNNIRLTRAAFGLGDVEDRSFPAAEELTPEVVEEHRAVLGEVRLWDWRALDDVYAQFQEFRLYYEFLDVDVDRYRIGDDYRQVMVSARELDQRNLPAQSQTFVNQVFKYTHGYGLTLAPVHEFTDDGLPELLVQDIPPRSAHPDLAVTRPELYFGEIGTPVVANSSEAEFHYPQGEQNVYVHYDGDGGVRLENLWRRLVFGWTHFGTKFLLSDYPTDDSRILYHRPIRERVAKLAPFLRLDADPYVALVDGRIVWIQDAYTVSNDFPYSEPFSGVEAVGTRDGQGVQVTAQRVVPGLAGVNYVRNSVKAVVDAYDGSVTLYVFEPDDPIVSAWAGVYPGLFRGADEMPAEVRAHVRYPADYLLVQGLMYAKYHMEDPVVFYNQEDLWVRATEQHYGRVQTVDPYYVMWQLPGAEAPEFALILPFTPKNRQVAIGWIAGLSDGDNYGRFLAYQFPKDQRVVGPQQVETKIDQDPVLSAQLSLWDQRGSRVLRGNVLAIPIGDALLYVEPIYLRAETAAFPELRLVVLMVGDDMVFAETFEEALAKLIGEDEAPEVAEAPQEERRAPAGTADLRELAVEADRLFRQYLTQQGAGELSAAGRTLERLSAVLERMAVAPGAG